MYGGMPGMGRMGPSAGAWERLVSEKRQRKQAARQAKTDAVARGGIAEGSEAWDALPTDEKIRRYMAEGQGALAQSIQSTVSGALPEFDQRLQGIRDSVARRNVGGGDTASGYETKLADEFKRSIADAIAGRSLDLYNTALERQVGYRDFRTGQSNAKAAGRNALWGSLGSVAGSWLGGR